MLGESDIFDYEDGMKDVLLTLSSLVSFYTYCLIAYSSFYFFFPQKKWIHILVGLGLAILIPIGLRYFIQEIAFDYLFGYTNYRKGISALAYIRDNLYFSFRFISFGIFFYLISFSFYKERSEKSLHLEKQKMELSLLRSQINPHFLLNSLNNIYSLVYHKSEKALDALDTLSDMLKYSLYQIKEEVSLEEEMKNVDKFLHLSKMRYNYPLALDIQIPAELRQLKIPQFLILPLVENAIKHAISKIKQGELLLELKKEQASISLSLYDNGPSFPHSIVKGYGLKSTYDKLQLLYPERHSIELVNQPEKYIRIILYNESNESKA